MYVLLPLLETNDLIGNLIIISYEHRVSFPKQVGLSHQAQYTILHIFFHLLVQTVEIRVDDNHFSQVECPH